MAGGILGHICCLQIDSVATLLNCKAAKFPYILTYSSMSISNALACRRQFAGIRHHKEQNLAEDQFEFRKGRGTGEPIPALNRETFPTRIIGLEKEFGKVQWKLLFRTLKEEK